MSLMPGAFVRAGALGVVPLRAELVELCALACCLLLLLFLVEEPRVLSARNAIRNLARQNAVVSLRVNVLALKRVRENRFFYEQSLVPPDFPAALLAADHPFPSTITHDKHP